MTQEAADHEVVEHGHLRERADNLESAANPAQRDLVRPQPVDGFTGERDRPESGASAPAIKLKSVVLPAPFGPITAKISPASTEKLTASTAVNPRKRFVTASTTSSVMAGP